MTSSAKQAGPYVAPQTPRRAGSYALLEVPNELDGLGHSFLRLGVSKLDWRSQPGADLVQMFPRDNPDNWRKAEYADDRRAREGGPDHWPQAQREAWTQELFDKGGWWDHSGGNRITTTDGDKLEIVRGNYRMAALGRQPASGEGASEDWGDAAGWDISGGIIRKKQRLPTKTFSISWVDTWADDKATGTWAVVKETKRGDFKDTFWGNRVTRTYGDELKTTIGSDSPGDETPNPDIIDKTWAGEIKEYKGSAKTPIDEIAKDTWINDIKENTFALALSSSTEALTIQSATNAGVISEETTYLLNTSAEIGGVRQGMSLLALARDISVCGGKIGVATSIASLKVGVCPATVELGVGARVGVRVGDTVGVRVGNSVGIEIGNKVGVTLAPINLALQIAPIKIDAFLGLGLAIKLIGFKIGLNSDKEGSKTWNGVAFSVF